MKENSKKEIKFLADKMLGKLVSWLRILGFDTVYSPVEEDSSLILIARKENRILLTRDTNLIRRRTICDFLFIKSDKWEEQLLEIINGLKIKLGLKSKIFSRCSLCNSPTIKRKKLEVKDYVPPYVYLTQNEFVYCPNCKKYYWKGTHWERMNKKIQSLLTNK